MENTSSDSTNIFIFNRLYTFEKLTDDRLQGTMYCYVRRKKKRNRQNSLRCENICVSIRYNLLHVYMMLIIIVTLMILDENDFMFVITS